MTTQYTEGTTSAALQQGSSDTGTETSSADHIAANIERLVSVCHGELGFLSAAEASEQLQYAQRVRTDRSVLSDAKSSYSDSMTNQTINTNRSICKKVSEKLDTAMESNVISSASYDEWLRWLKDPRRKSTEKKNSISSELGSYLRKREVLANERLLLMKDARVNNPDSIKDSYLQGHAKYLMDNDRYFNELSFSGRRNLLKTIKAYLEASKGGKGYEKQFKDLKEELVKEATSSQPALHRDKVGYWLEKVYKDDPKPKEVERRTENLRKLIKVWRANNIEFWDLRDDEAFEGVRTAWLDTGSFLARPWKKRKAYVANMKAQKALAKELKSKTNSKISNAAWALDSSGKDRWFSQYVFNGSHSLKELSSIISGPLSQRLSEKMSVVSDFDEACKKAQDANVDNSKIPDRNAFLSKKFQLQLFALHDLNDAIKEKELEAKTPTAEIQPQTESEDSKLQISKLNDEINEQLDTSIGPPANYLIGDSCERGGKSIDYLRKYIGNFKWCVDHGYMNPSNTETLDQASEKDTKKILKKNRLERRRGFENIDLDNASDKKNAMRPYEKTWAPALYHITCSKASSRQTLLNKFDNQNVGLGNEGIQGHDPQADKYWSTLHIRDISYGENYRLAQDEMWKLKSKILRIEGLGGHFERKQVSIKEDDVVATRPSSKEKQDSNGTAEPQVSLAA